MKGFFVAPHSNDATLLGVAFRAIESLSSKWVDAASQFLEAHGHSFHANWGAELGRFETRLTSGGGAGLATFYVDGESASSHLYLSGQDVKVESEVISMFIESMRNVRMIQLSEGLVLPFGNIRQIPERPVDVAVIWAPESVSNQDLEAIRDLSLHFAAAFFLRHLIAH